jgi:hypothetical protein
LIFFVSLRPTQHLGGGLCFTFGGNYDDEEAGDFDFRHVYFDG